MYWEGLARWCRSDQTPVFLRSPPALGKASEVEASLALR